jgi:alanine dehydrogenase
MIIGIPKEIWRDERRLPLTPAGVYALTRGGHTVLIQEDAGSGCGFWRSAFEDAGASVAFSAEEVFARADCVVKIMPPTMEETKALGKEKFLFSWAQMGVINPEVFRMLIQQQTTTVGYELIENESGGFPVLSTMSEIAGLLLPQIAARFLESTGGGRGISLGGVAGIPASNIVIVGAGEVGQSAARSFHGIGANVMVLDSDLGRLRKLQQGTGWNLNTAVASQYNLERYVSFADVLVGAVFIPGQKTPHVISESMVRRMKQGSVILDVSIDQGGCVETSRPTTLSDPVFLKHGVIHYCVPNIASSVARTASHALNNVLLPYVEDIADRGFSAFALNSMLRRGVYLYQGQCTNAALAKMMDLDFAEVEPF